MFYDADDWAADIVALYKSDFFDHTNFLCEKFKGLGSLHYIETDYVDNFILITAINPAVIDDNVKIRNIWIHTNFYFRHIHDRVHCHWRPIDSIDVLINLMKVFSVMSS